MGRDDPLVSVVLPTYNRGPNLARAVETVCEQTYEPVELVVVDDCSETPATEWIPDDVEHSLSNFELVRHQVNKGGSAARNTGIEAARGEYVAFLDDDDCWAETKLETQIDTLERRSDAFVAAYCDVEFEARDGVFFSEHRERLEYRKRSPTVSSAPMEGGSELVPHVLRGSFNLGGSSTLVVESETVEAVDGFDARFERHQDWEFLIRVLQRGKLAFTDAKLVRKEMSDDPDPSTEWENKELLFDAFEAEIREAETNGEPVIDSHKYYMAKAHARAGNFRRSLQFLLESETSLYRICRLGPAVAMGVASTAWLSGR